MYKALIYLLPSIILFVLGYNFVFNTRVTLTKYASLSGYKEGSHFHKLLASDSNVLWVRIAGIGVMIFAIMLLIGFVVVTLNKQGL